MLHIMHTGGQFALTTIMTRFYNPANTESW